MDNQQINLPELSFSQFSDLYKIVNDLKNTQDWSNSQDSQNTQYSQNTREKFNEFITNSQRVFDNSSLVRIQSENTSLKEVYLFLFSI
jgi:hypothetical protein